MNKAQASVHPSFMLLLFILLGIIPFIFQDPRLLIVDLLLNFLIVTKLGWPSSVQKAYLLVGGLGGLFTAISWLLFTREGFVYWQSEIPLIQYPVQITDIGILWALGMGLRIANVAMLSMFYLFATSPRQIAIALKGIGVPFSVGFLISLVFRFIPLVKNDLFHIREAQMVRGLQVHEGTLFEKMRKYSYLMVPLIFTSLKRVQLIANALDAKGFTMRNPRHRFFRMPIWKTWEAIVLFAALCAVSVLFYLARISSAEIGVLLSGRI